MNFRTFQLPFNLAMFGLAFLAAGAAPLRVLFFTKSSGYEHSVVKQVGGQPSYSERVLAGLAAQHDLAITGSKDGSLFAPGYFARFDVIVFYTCGDLLAPDNNGQPGITPTGKQAALDAVAAGKGFVGLHSTCLISSGSLNVESRYHNQGETADPFVRMLGCEYLNHNAQQVARARVVDRDFPGCAELGDSLEFKEEWSSLKEFSPDLHVILALDTAGMTGDNYARPPFPLGWARMHGQGRVCFNALGHREDVWDNPKFQAMVLGAIEWAGGRKTADLTPNLKQVTPDADTLPPFHPGN